MRLQEMLANGTRAITREELPIQRNTLNRGSSLKNTTSRGLAVNFNKPLSNFDLYDLVKELGIKNFIGVLSIDGLPFEEIRKPSMHQKTTIACIVNLDSQTGPGTHWVSFRCVINNRNGSNIFEYFDSYGLPPPKEIIKFYKELDKGIQLVSSHDLFFWNRDELQDFDTVTCGWWCLYFLLERQKDSLHGIDFVDSWLQTLHPVLWHRGKGREFLENYFIPILN